MLLRLGIAVFLGCTMVMQSLRLGHQFWLTAPKATIKITDRAWNYCDQKCLYLESFIRNTDFIVLHFKDKALKPNFAGCYAKLSDGSYSLWNKVINNTFFERLCGGDKDWLALGKYTITNVDGQGIGSPLKY